MLGNRHFHQGSTACGFGFTIPLCPSPSPNFYLASTFLGKILLFNLSYLVSLNRLLFFSDNGCYTAFNGYYVIYFHFYFIIFTVFFRGLQINL